ncbi:hypothetical protein [Lactobacillus crispatus]|nr:hypothetical protein [Lactobacillus crispatus]
MDSGIIDGLIKILLNLVKKVPNLIPMNSKYYLFTTIRLNRGTGDDL